MERGSTKHGPLHDEQLARETEGLVRDAPQPDRTEEWRETEPLDDPRELYEAETERPGEQEAIDLRSELARLLTRDEFPAGREELLAILDDRDASPALVARVGDLPADDRYASTHEVLTALGISHPEDGEGA